MMTQAKLDKNIVDDISGGAIVKMRDRLLAMQKTGRKVYRLESGDPSFAVPEHVLNAIATALKDGKTHYTESTGIPQLREAVSQKLIKKNKISSATPANVVVTNGGMNAIYVVFRSLLSPNDKVLIPDPMWTEIGEIAKLSSGKPVSAKVDGYADECRNKIKSEGGSFRAIFLNSPHNPTGKYFPESEIKKLVDVAAEYGLWLISDEAYEDVIYDERVHTSPASIYPSTISLYSMSKTYAMSGLRIGYAHVPDPALLERVKKLLRCTINGVNSATQYGAVAALQGPQDNVAVMRKEYQKRRDILYAGVKKNSALFEPKLPEGAFYLWAKIPKYPAGVNNSWDMCEYILEKTGVGSSPGSVFGSSGEGHVRFSFSCSTEMVQEAADIIQTLKA